MASEVALKEVAYAAALNKRLAPIICKPVEIDSIPEILRRLNFVDFDDPARFEANARELVKALRTDIGWIRHHTELGKAAQDWSDKGRPRGLLLRSPALEEAEHWIAARPPGTPPPTPEINRHR